MIVRRPALLLASLVALLCLGACPPGSGEPTCEAYCAAVSAHCTGGSAQYASEAECNQLCNANALGFTVGTSADESGNTLGCRLYHASAAANDEHCEHAGPTGGDVCGAWCDVYCDAALSACTAANTLYGDRATCLTSCSHLPATGGTTDLDGDSVQCRIRHLAVAGAAPETHCPHGSASGDNVCGTLCEVYCDTMEAACPDTYTDRASCDAACGNFPIDGSYGDLTGDTLQCRVSHAGVANDDAHCEHASNASTADTCG